MDDEESIPARRSSDVSPAQIGDLNLKVDRLQSALDRVLARLDLLVLPRVASMNAKADILEEILEKLDTLVAALSAEDEDEQPSLSLEGEYIGRERNKAESLG